MKSKPVALVEVWAKRYETFRPVGGAEIVDLRTGERWRTGADGYAHLRVETGRTLCLAFNKAGFPDTQTATVTVPEQGLTGPDNEITLQAPSRGLYRLLRLAVGKPKPGTHYIVTTVSAAGRNLHDNPGEEGRGIAFRTPDGEKGVSVALKSLDGKTVLRDAMYLGNIGGISEWVRPILTARLPFLRALRARKTSRDGGLIFRDVPPGEYVLEASKTGRDGRPMAFTSTRVSVLKDSPELINASPPHGPKVLAPPRA